MTQREQILSLCSRPEGWSLDEAPEGIPRSSAFSHVSRLVVAGLVFRGSQRHFARYWTDPAKAEAHTQAMREEFERRDKAYRAAYCERQKAERAAQRALKPTKKPKPHQAPYYPRKTEAKPAPVTFKAPKVKWEDMPARITSETKVTICPSPALFGAAARIAYGKPAKVPAILKVGKDV